MFLLCLGLKKYHNDKDLGLVREITDPILDLTGSGCTVSLLLSRVTVAEVDQWCVGCLAPPLSCCVDPRGWASPPSSRKCWRSTSSTSASVYLTLRDSQGNRDQMKRKTEQLSKKKCWGFVTFWCGSGSADPYLWLTDPNRTPDPTLFFSDFKDAKKLFFSSYFFLLLNRRQINFSL